ncbi:restriction endonuclease subunit S [Enterobacter hormaechei]|uniref:restriction endonuclease subunit S n=1 Tax=Enterobacter hormaechei TaxID=158836 RepID=UPI001D0CC1F2|nr:restriction endonuclease subunit S [Enterobacter hormaechei]MCC2015409.1 restriction endonuclease subunit S [Enterobacter hormaechei]MCS0520343.1 restriction endonuclease subunit S [Enterobacter hormaechei]MDV5640570.1 restriction endonuclease subunit S [Enterobacter hormaechei]
MVPKLRFTSFKDTWSSAYLSKLIVSLDAGVSVNSIDELPDDNEHSILKTSCVSFGYFDNTERKKVVKDEIPRLKEMLVSNSILISRMNTPALVGANAYIKDAPENTFVPDRLWQVKVNDNICNIKWLANFLSSDKGRSLLKEQASGTSNSMKNITKKDVFQIMLDFPSKEEQTKIADFLSSADEKITLMNKQYDLLCRYKKGMMQKIFSQEVRFKDEYGEDFPVWHHKSLGDICRIRTGKLDANAMVVGGKYRFYTCAREFYQIDEYAFDTEALLISGNGANVGYIHYYSGKFNAYQRTYVLDGFNHNIAYVKYFLDMYLNERIYGEKKEGNTPYIVMGTLADMQIKLPIIKEQTKIANFLSSLDDKITTKKAELDKLKTWKQGLLQQMFV